MSLYIYTPTPRQATPPPQRGSFCASPLSPRLAAAVAAGWKCSPLPSRSL
uniref:Uncharacterized protein n=1 Tax=uncultured marine virus TaxID=186617 RepID=A0A0F7L080_9VIRU|nr:hypothetical protein [uncultured marine virus]